jgi:hypothetical protein
MQIVGVLAGSAPPKNVSHRLPLLVISMSLNHRAQPPWKTSVRMVF